jgi:hypothetical protein
LHLLVVAGFALLEVGTVISAVGIQLLGIGVDLDDGRTVKAICRGPQGAWGVPLDPAAHREKLLDCFSRALPASKVSELVALFERLETLDTAGVAQLVALIASARQEKK